MGMLSILCTSAIVTASYVPYEPAQSDSSPTSYMLYIVPIAPISPVSPQFQFPTTPSFGFHASDSSPTARPWPNIGPLRDVDTVNTQSDNIPTQTQNPNPSETVAN